MLVRNLGSVAGVNLIQILTFVSHSNWLVTDIFRTIYAKMLLFCKVTVYHTSVSSKSFCGLVLSDPFRELFWEMGEWLLRAGPRLLFDVRTAEVSAPRWVITMPSAHLTCLELTWYVDHRHDRLSLTCLCVFVSFKLCKAKDTGIIFPAYLKTLNPCCTQGRNPLFHFLWCSIISKDRTRLIHESVPYMPLVSYMPKQKATSVVTRKEQMFLSPWVTVSSALLTITTHLDQSGYLCSTVLFALWEIIRGWSLLKKKNQQNSFLLH